MDFVNLFKIFIFLSLVLICTTHGENNIWIAAYTTFVNNTEKFFVDFITRGRFGYTVISLYNEKLNFTATTFFTEGTIRNFFENYGNLTFLPKQQQNNESFTAVLLSPPYERVFGKVFNEIETLIELPINFATNKTKIFVGKKKKINF